ncbi:MAG TPA: G/U mismatch-specific DNA glycosylase [Gemmatimonadaceae bacterium]|nr:G/U mismatch-specific DNA glycosylase [Gemmatimonadaceae bacterium]
MGRDKISGHPTNAGRRPSAADVRAAAGRTLPDVIAPDLRVLFCGINPGLYSAAVGHHFARPGNRFWPAVHRAGFTPTIFEPQQDGELPALGLGLTNLAGRATAGAAELSPEELRAGGERLLAKLDRYRPRWVAFLGIGAYRVAFGHPDAVPGRQSHTWGRTRVWLLPSPSGANGSYPLEALVREFRALARNSR